MFVYSFTSRMRTVQVTVRNHNRSTALEQSVLKYWWGGGVCGLNRFYGIPTSPSASVMAQNI